MSQSLQNPAQLQALIIAHLSNVEFTVYSDNIEFYRNQLIELEKLELITKRDKYTTTKLGKEYLKRVLKTPIPEVVFK